MKTLKIMAIAILATTAIALSISSVFAYMGRSRYYAQSPWTSETAGTYTNISSGATTYGGYYGGMMGRGRGCGGLRVGYGAPAYANPATATPLGINGAVTIAQNYVASIGNTNLAVSEVEEYALNFYVQVEEKDTGKGAFELIVDKYTGAVSAEMGPNMMWNTKYGMHGRMMGWLTGAVSVPATVTVEQARTIAQQYLNAYYSGTSVGDVEAFYGYYHVDVVSLGKTYGMLSVNSYTGQVWYHTWHGAFVQEIELG